MGNYPLSGAFPNETFFATKENVWIVFSVLATSDSGGVRECEEDGSSMEKKKMSARSFSEEDKNTLLFFVVFFFFPTPHNG
jgi:hypothetical protein